MNRIIFAFAAVLALMALPNASYATHCGKERHGCLLRHHHVHAAPAPRVDRLAALRADIDARWAKLRAERAASGAAFRAGLAQMFARVPRPAVVAAPARPCTLFTRAAAAPVAAAPRRSCGLLASIAGCLHRASCAR